MNESFMHLVLALCLARELVATVKTILFGFFETFADIYLHRIDGEST